jgi:hypothetical protein
MRLFTLWWLNSCLVVGGVYIANKFGIFYRILETDFTYLCWVIMAIGIYAIIRCGHLSYQAAIAKKKRELRLIKIKQEQGWTLASLVQKCGLIGTIAGFIYATMSFNNIDFTNMTTTQTVIKELSVGVSTALYTTICGLITNTIIVLQYHSLLTYIDKRLEK